MAEVTTFPSPSPAASELPAAAETEPPKPKRVVITPDGLVSALQGKLRQAAEKAAEAAVAKHVDEAVRRALSKIDDVRLTSIREIEELFPARIQSLKLPSKDELAGEIASHWKEQMEIYRGQAEELAQRLERQAEDLRREMAKSQEFVDRMSREIEPQIHAKMNESVSQASNEFEGATARAVERRYEQMLAGTHAVTQEALLKLDARSAEVQALVQSAVNAALGAFQRQSEMQVSMALAETKERAVAALSSLDAESRAACDARRQAIESDVARAAERSTDQFRKSMKAFLYSCLVAAVSAVDEHSKATLDGLVKDNGKTIHEGNGETRTQDDTPIIPEQDIDPLTH
jgi:predicted phage tail protein